MKTIFILALVSTLSYSQNVYQVEPGMKGNKVILTIENASTSLSIDELKITETNNSKFIEMKVDEYRITNMHRAQKEILKLNLM